MAQHVKNDFGFQVYFYVVRPIEQSHYGPHFVFDQLLCST